MEDGLWISNEDVGLIARQLRYAVERAGLSLDGFVDDDRMTVRGAAWIISRLSQPGQRALPIEHDPDWVPRSVLTATQQALEQERAMVAQLHGAGEETVPKYLYEAAIGTINKVHEVAGEFGCPRMADVTVWMRGALMDAATATPLRDVFAGQAMQGFAACEDHFGSIDHMANLAYTWADAMLEARKPKDF